uniref:hypothetical protein n=1 Tax=Aeromonas sp. Ne-1 TaxID=1675689 RepID=UPI001565CC24|nr:hypothetical protein [Aeromonas sp. Ne-1]
MTQEVSVMDLYGRFINLHMKGTWGYVKPELKAIGFTMLTADSYIEEFEVKDFKVLDSETGETLPHTVLIGEDKYGRELTVPVNRIISVNVLDTDEQKQLKNLNILINTYSAIDNLKEKNSELYADLEKFIKDREELLSKGIKVYEREQLKS